MLIVTPPMQSKIDRGVVHIFVVCHIFENYCLRFEKGVVLIFLVGYSVDLTENPSQTHIKIN